MFQHRQMCRVCPLPALQTPPFTLVSPSGLPELHRAPVSISLSDPSILHPQSLPVGGPPPTTVVQYPPAPSMSNHFNLWPDDKVRNQFLIFFIANVIPAALDIAFDVLFAVESSRVLLVEQLPDSSSLRHFFPATVAVLGLSMLITMYANIPVFRRTVLVSRAQHEEESQGDSRLVWQEFAPAVANVFRVLLVQPVSGLFSMLVEVMNIIFNFYCSAYTKLFPPAASPPTPPVPPALGSDRSRKPFLISGPSSVFQAFVWLAKAVSVLMRNMISLCSLSMAGK